MGHAGDETFQFYISEIVAVDAQSIVLGKTPDHAFIEMNQSMGMDINATAHQPPGSRLTDVAGSRDSADDAMQQLSLAQQSDVRRQMRNRNYTKKREEFWEQTEGLFVEDCSDGISEEEPVASPNKRAPSRYLTALLRHYPVRRELTEIMFTEQDLSIVTVVTLMHSLASPPEQRTTYAGVQVSKDGICPVCRKKLHE